jgi:hypothetical protein
MTTNRRTVQRAMARTGVYNRRQAMTRRGLSLDAAWHNAMTKLPGESGSISTRGAFLPIAMNGGVFKTTHQANVSTQCAE